MGASIYIARLEWSICMHDILNTTTKQHITDLLSSNLHWRATLPVWWTENPRSCPGPHHLWSLATSSPSILRLRTWFNNSRFKRRWQITTEATVINKFHIMSYMWNVKYPSRSTRSSFKFINIIVWSKYNNVIIITIIVAYCIPLWCKYQHARWM